MKYKAFIVVALAAVLLGFSAGIALADNGPHGGYTATTDACAGCHRAHTAVGPSLLVANSAYDLCITCHGSAGTGADTNVADGLYLERDSVTEAPAQGFAGRGLRGGGFDFGTMDTNVDAVSAPAVVTSNHIADGSAGTAWGNGAIGSGPGALNFSLGCTSCHDPHGRAGTGQVPTYRILRARPTGSGAGSDVNVAEEGSKNYTVANGDNEYYGENYGVARTGQLSQWCSQCHTRYLAGVNSGHTDSGDPIFMYRHTTSSASVGCVTCHVAHGTTATMGTLSGAVAWPDGATTPNGNNRSSLLRVDNRGVCELCHGK